MEMASLTSSLRSSTKTRKFLSLPYPRRPQRLSHRRFSTVPSRLYANTSTSTSTSTSTAEPSTPKKYTTAEITTLTTHPDPHRILIDVREPAELQTTGRIPGAVNLPLTTSPDFMFLSATEFENRFGVARPGPEDEVIFYCKAGVRCHAAARLAGQAGFGGVVSEYPGSWLEWEKEGGARER